MNNQDFIDFHLSKNYYVKVKQVDEKMLTALFPENTTFRPFHPRLLKTYVISYDEVEIYGSDGTKVKHKVPIYTKRLVVLKDITSTAASYGILSNLILSYDKDDKLLDNKTSLLHLMREPKKQSEKDLESKLLDVLVKIINDEDFEVTDDIKDGFNFIIRGYDI